MIRTATALTVASAGLWLFGCCKLHRNDAAEVPGAPSASVAPTGSENYSALPVKQAPAPGPGAWQAAISDALKDRPAKEPGPDVKAPGLLCANTLGQAYLKEKFRAAWVTKTEERDAGEPARVEDWRKRYRPWYLRRESLLGALSEGCEVSGTSAFSGACAPLRDAWGRFATAASFSCSAIGAWTASPETGDADIVLCEPEGTRGYVLLALPRSQRAALLEPSLLATVNASGIAPALGIPLLKDREPSILVATVPATLEVRQWHRVQRHPRSSGFLNRTLRALRRVGMSSTFAAEIASKGDVWEIVLGEGSPSVVLVKRNDAPPPPPPAPAAEEDNDPAPEAEDDEPAEATAAAVPVPAHASDSTSPRWDRALDDVLPLGGWVLTELETPMPLSRERSSVRVGSVDPAPGDGFAVLRPVRREEGAQRFFERVSEFGGFDDILCTLEDVSRPAKQRLSQTQRIMASRAGVDPLSEFIFRCKGTETTSLEAIDIHVPSHLVWVRGAMPPELAQRGLVHVDGYVADPDALFTGELRSMRQTDPPFANLGRGTKLKIKGYSALWREDRRWQVAFKPECRDEGFGCVRNDGFTPSIEITEPVACDVTGFKYP